MVGCVDLTLVRSPLAVSKSLKGQKKRWLDYDGNTAPDLGLFLDKCMDCVGNGARWVEVCPLWALSLILFMHLIWWSTCFHFTKSPTEVSVIVRVEMPLGWVDKLQRPQRLRELLHWFTLLCFIFYLYLSETLRCVYLNLTFCYYYQLTSNVYVWPLYSQYLLHL